MANSKKNGFVGAMDSLPWLVKLLLCIPALNIVWAVYRIVKGYTKKNTIMLVIGILWIIPGAVFCWLVDMICVIIWKQPKLFA